MRHNSFLLALAVTLGVGLPALADNKPAGCQTHNCAADKNCSSEKGCGPDHKNCGPACPKVAQAPKPQTQAQPQSKPDACEHGKPDACEHGKPDACEHGKGDACQHAKPDACEHGKDCDDADCKAQRQACEHGDDCDDAACEGGKRASEHGQDCDHHGRMGGHRRQVEEEVVVRRRGMMMGRGMGMRHRAGGAEWRARYQWNLPTNNAYLMFNAERTFGRDSRQRMWWNPNVGGSCSFGFDVADQTNNNHLGLLGAVAQNTMHFGAVNVRLGVMVGGGVQYTTTQTLNFTSANLFYAADPRLSVGVQVTPKASIEATGSYLFTSRPAAVGGPSASLGLRYRF